MITSILDNQHRTKEELVALYRYRFRKGIDQESLSIFMSDTTQKNVSRYLSQVQNAIYKDFVPVFVWAGSRPRKLFLTKNTICAKKLYNMTDDSRCFIADAKYTRLEKRANNDFQYNSWSQQKMDLLIKPFTICCSDGYFVDCYGPLKANINDANILRHVLDTDHDLLKLLKPNKTVIILDRGINNILIMI